MLPALVGVLVMLLGLPLASVAHKLLRDRRETRAALRADALRPALTRLALGEGRKAEILADVSFHELIPAAGRLLTKLRGTDRERLAGALAREGVIDRAIRETRSLRAPRRAAAAHLLGAAGAVAAVPDLARLIDDRHPDVRGVAARALGRVGDPRGARAVLNALSDPQVLSRGMVGLSLVRMGSDAAPALREALSSVHPEVRTVAADVLGQFGDLEAADALGRALHDAEPSVRLAAAGALRRIGAPQTRPALAAAATSDPSRGVRAAAATALGPLDPQRSIGALSAALTDPEHEVARAAAFVLTRGGVEAHEELLRTAIGDGPGNAEAREALQRVGK